MFVMFRIIIIKNKYHFISLPRLSVTLEMRSQQDTLKILQDEFNSLEYENFSIAPAKCKRLVRRSVMIIKELLMSPIPMTARLSSVLSAALYIVNYCRGEEGVVERILMSLSCSPLFEGLYERLSMAWGSSPPSWHSENIMDEGTDQEHSFKILKSNKTIWEPYGESTSGDLWHLLASLSEASGDQSEIIESKILAKYSRQFTIIDTRDFQHVTELRKTRFHHLKLGHYRGTEVVIKNVNSEYLNANIQQNIMIAAPALVKTIHPNIIPLLGVSVVDDMSVSETAQPCAITVSAHAPGPSLDELWYRSQTLPSPANAIVLVSFIADALLYLAMGDKDNFIAEGIISELPASNCIIDPDTRQPRILLTIKSDDKIKSRWSPPIASKNKYCYMIGLLLWASLSGAKPLPQVTTQTAINEALQSGSWRPSLGSHIPNSINDFVLSACAHEDDSFGFSTLTELVEALQTFPKIESTLPVDEIDDFGEDEAEHPLRSPASGSKPWPVSV